MPKKLGGLVCDGCRVFCAYGYDKIKKWHIVASGLYGNFYYCSKKCMNSHDRSKDE